MRLEDVMDEAAGVLEDITGLRVHAHPPGSVSPPAGIVSYPDSIDYDATYGDDDTIKALQLVLVANKASDRAARDKVSAWSAKTGPQSVKARMEAHTWTSCDDFHVMRCEFDVVTIGGTDYLAAIFSADIMGSGE